MTSAQTLADIFHIKARFSRSVNIVADYGDTGSVSDYILTPLGRTVIRRVSEGFTPGSRARAWSVTGPYGSGKSACALFLSRVVGAPVDAAARAKLREVDRELLSQLVDSIPDLADQGFLVVPIVGSRQPLAAAVLKGLIDALRAGAPNSVSTELLQRLEALAHDAHAGVIAVPEVVDMIRQVASAARTDHALGVLIILDELGKFLEYASLNPTQGDIYLLQALAELAARSGDSPIGLLAILHQSFERYGARLGPIQQREWAKVQGRFEDIGFIESAGELLRLIGSAIEGPNLASPLADVVMDESRHALTLGIIPRELGQSEGVSILQRCAPLHPTVALVLGRLFRSRLAQNERSLFAFLTSGEPHGLRDFLLNEQWDGDGHLPYYRLDDLYDYIVAAMGSALYAQTQGKRWAEIEDALDRLPHDASRLEARLVKTTGLLGLLGDQRNVKASESILGYALADGERVTDQDVRQAIERLRGLGSVVYRQHKDAFGLWEGSDIDLEERFQKGLDHVDKSASLAALLQRRPPLKPFVAKRHLHETGTLRFFAPWIVDMTDLSTAPDRPFAGADGMIVYVLGNDSLTTEEILTRVQAISAALPSPRNRLMFFAVPKNVAGIRETLDSFSAPLRWGEELQ